MAVASDMVEATEVAQGEAGCSEAHVASEAPEGNTNSLHIDAEKVNIELVLPLTLGQTQPHPPHPHHLIWMIYL